MWFTDSSTLADTYPNAVAVLLPAQQDSFELCASWLKQSLDVHSAAVDWQITLWQHWLQQWPYPAALDSTLFAPEQQQAKQDETKPVAETKPAAATTPATETKPKPAAKAPADTAAAPEDLTAIAGIGPAIAKKLIASGIHSFQQIASWTEQDIDRVEATIMAGRFAGRIRRDDWIGQARTLSAR